MARPWERAMRVIHRVADQESSSAEVSGAKVSVAWPQSSSPERSATEET
jgi:hypothetical protein